MCGIPVYLFQRRCVHFSCSPLTDTPVQFLGQVFVCTHMPVEFTCISVLFTLVCNVYPYVTLYLVTFMNLYVSRVVLNDGLIDFHYCEKKIIKS